MAVQPRHVTNAQLNYDVTQGAMNNFYDQSFDNTGVNADNNVNCMNM